MSDQRWLDDAEDPARQALRQALDEREAFTHSELMQRRVWARVSDPARTRRATRRAFVSGALAASALTALVAMGVERVRVLDTSMDALTGRSTVAQAVPPAPTVVALAVTAPAGSIIETRAGERLVRLLPQGARAELEPRTLLTLDAQGRAELRHGEVRFVLTAQAPSDKPFVVTVASYRVIVAGTRFVVRAQPQRIGVDVEEGAAEIWNGTRMVRIGAGETWTSVAGSGRAAARAAHEKTLALSETAPAQEQQDREDLAAARAARASDPRRALALYERLAARGGPSAENALYELGGIYHDQLKQPQKALQAWDKYRTRYPSGLLRAEADLSVIDTLNALDEGNRTLNEALAFLKRYPRSERRGEVARVVGDIYRVRGNCRAAIDFYRVVQGTKVSAEDADEASWGQAACLYAVRDEGAQTALRGYVGQNPRGRHLRDASRLLGDKAAP